MKIIRYLIFSLFILILLSNCSKEDDRRNCQFQLKASDNLDDLDYQLYSLMLKELFTNAENLVIAQETQAVFPDGAYFQNLKDAYPEMDTPVFSDYILKNDTVYQFENKFNVPSKVISMVTSEEMNYFFHGTDDINKGWEEFYRRFPNSAGEISFTRIGYNTDRTRAMAEVGNMYASLGGEGFLIFLELENTEWIIAKIIPTWIS